MENVDPRIWFWFSTKRKKTKKIEFSDSGFPPKRKKKKTFKKKKNVENVDPRIYFWFSTKKKKI